MAEKVRGSILVLTLILYPNPSSMRAASFASLDNFLLSHSPYISDCSSLRSFAHSTSCPISPVSFNSPTLSFTPSLCPLPLNTTQRVHFPLQPARPPHRQQSGTVQTLGEADRPRAGSHGIDTAERAESSLGIPLREFKFCLPSQRRNSDPHSEPHTGAALLDPP